MAKSITQDSIIFSNYATGNDTYSLGKTLRLGTNEGLDEDNFGIVNAVDIAWNGANFTSAPGTTTPTTINTTGLLIDAIKWASKQGGSSSLNSYTINKYNSASDLAEINGTYDIIEASISENVSLFGFSQYPEAGHICNVIIRNTGEETINISINKDNTPFIFPNNEGELLIQISPNCYTEINFLSINEDNSVKVYVRTSE